MLQHPNGERQYLGSEVGLALGALHASDGQVQFWVVVDRTAESTSKMEVGDGGQVHLDGVSLEYLAEVGSKEIDGVLGPWKRGQIELGAEGVILPDTCPVGGGC